MGAIHVSLRNYNFTVLPFCRNNATVRLGFYDGNRHVNEVYKSHAYKLRVTVANAPADTGIRVRSCFGFGNNASVPLVDDDGYFF